MCCHRAAGGDRHRGDVVNVRRSPAGHRLATGSGARTVHVGVELVTLELELADPALDHVPDADHTGEHAVDDHGHVPYPAVGHRLHQLEHRFGAVARVHV